MSTTISDSNKNMATVSFFKGYLNHIWDILSISADVESDLTVTTEHKINFQNVNNNLLWMDKNLISIHTDLHIQNLVLQSDVTIRNGTFNKMNIIDSNVTFNDDIHLNDISLTNDIQANTLICNTVLSSGITTYNLYINSRLFIIDNIDVINCCYMRTMTIHNSVILESDLFVNTVFVNNSININDTLFTNDVYTNDMECYYDTICSNLPYIDTINIVQTNGDIAIENSNYISFNSTFVSFQNSILIDSPLFISATLSTGMVNIDGDISIHSVSCFDDIVINANVEIKNKAFFHDMVCINSNLYTNGVIESDSLLTNICLTETINCIDSVLYNLESDKLHIINHLIVDDTLCNYIVSHSMATLSSICINKYITGKGVFVNET